MRIITGLNVFNFRKLKDNASNASVKPILPIALYTQNVYAFVWLLNCQFNVI